MVENSSNSYLFDVRDTAKQLLLDPPNRHFFRIDIEQCYQKVDAQPITVASHFGLQNASPKPSKLSKTGSTLHRNTSSDGKGCFFVPLDVALLQRQNQKPRLPPTTRTESRNRPRDSKYSFRPFAASLLLGGNSPMFWKLLTTSPKTIWLRSFALTASRRFLKGGDVFSRSLALGTLPGKSENR